MTITILGPEDGERDIVVCLPSGTTRVDPSPDEIAKRGVRLIAAETGIDVNATELALRLEKVTVAPAGVMGWSTGGWAALSLAARRPDLVSRVAVLATPIPEPSLGLDPGDVPAKTLLLHGSLDETAGSRHGRWWQQRLPNARLEVVPGARHDDLVPRMWPRVLSFLAPRAAAASRRA